MYLTENNDKMMRLLWPIKLKSVFFIRLDGFVVLLLSNFYVHYRFKKINYRIAEREVKIVTHERVLRNTKTAGAYSNST